MQPAAECAAPKSLGLWLPTCPRWRAPARQRFRCSTAHGLLAVQKPPSAVQCPTSCQGLTQPSASGGEGACCCAACNRHTGSNEGLTWIRSIPGVVASPAIKSSVCAQQHSSSWFLFPPFFPLQTIWGTPQQQHQRLCPVPQPSTRLPHALVAKPCMLHASPGHPTKTP